MSSRNDRGGGGGGGGGRASEHHQRERERDVHSRDFQREASLGAVSGGNGNGGNNSAWVSRPNTPGVSSGSGITAVPGTTSGYLQGQGASGGVPQGASSGGAPTSSAHTKDQHREGTPSAHTGTGTAFLVRAGESVSSTIDLRQNKVLAERYRCLARIGTGQFAEVWRVCDIEMSSQDNQIERALKVAQCGTNGKSHSKHSSDAASSVIREADILNELKARQRECPNVCHIVDSGKTSCGKYAYLAMPLLGENLYTRRANTQGGMLPAQTVYRYGVQMVRALQSVHQAGYIHRDVKPANFCVDNNGRLLIIDFGLAKKWCDEHSNPLPPRQDAQFRGSSTYASINVMKDVDQCRNDDLWSVLYILVECLTGELPWRFTTGQGKGTVVRKEKDENIALKVECLRAPWKLMCRPGREATARPLPGALIQFIDILKPCEFMEKPDYDNIVRVLEEAIKNDDRASRDAKAADAARAAMASPAAPPSSSARPSSGSAYHTPHQPSSAAPLHHQSHDRQQRSHTPHPPTSDRPQAYQPSTDAMYARYAPGSGSHPVARTTDEGLRHAVAENFLLASADMGASEFSRCFMQALEIQVQKASRLPSDRKRQVARFFEDIADYADQAKRRCMNDRR